MKLPNKKDVLILDSAYDTSRLNKPRYTELLNDMPVSVEFGSVPVENTDIMEGISEAEYKIIKK